MFKKKYHSKQCLMHSALNSYNARIVTVKQRPDSEQSAFSEQEEVLLENSSNIKRDFHKSKVY